MSAVPKDIVVDQKIAEIELEISRERARVEALKASLSVKDWNKPRPGATKRLYNLLESRYVLNLRKTWPNRSFYSQVEILGVRDQPGKFYPTDEVRILDWAELSGNQVQGGDIKSETAIKGNVKGGQSDPLIQATFRSKSTIEKQRAKEASLVWKARQLGGKLVCRGRDDVSGSKVAFEVDWRDYFKARLNTYAELPDKLLGLKGQGPVSARVIPKPPTATLSEPVSKLRGPVRIGAAGAATAARPRMKFPSADGRKITTVPNATARRGLDILAVNENDRMIGIEAKTSSRMTTPPTRMVPGTGAAARSIATGFITQYISDKAAAKRFERALKNDGWVPVGSEYVVGRGSSWWQRLGRIVIDPTVAEKIQSVPWCARFDVSLWRQGILRRAEAMLLRQPSFEETLTIWFPVVRQDGWIVEGSANYQPLRSADGGYEWFRWSQSIPAGTLMDNRTIDLEKIIDPDRDDDWVLGYLQLRDAMGACREKEEVEMFA